MEEELQTVLRRLQASLPAFPDGRIDYTDAPEAAGVSIFVCFDGRLLLLKRSQIVGTNKEKWSGQAGYLDELVPLADKVAEELREELGLTEEIVGSSFYGEPIRIEDGRIWHIYPVRIDLRQAPHIILDFEHTEYTWINPEELDSYDTVPGLASIWRSVAPLSE